jgi:hypothetical protein
VCVLVSLFQEHDLQIHNERMRCKSEQWIINNQFEIGLRDGGEQLKSSP